MNPYTKMEKIIRMKNQRSTDRITFHLITDQDGVTVIGMVDREQVVSIQVKHSPSPEDELIAGCIQTVAMITTALLEPKG